MSRNNFAEQQRLRKAIERRARLQEKRENRRAMREAKRMAKREIAGIEIETLPEPIQGLARTLSREVEVS